METFELTPSQIRLMISCLNDRQDAVLRKIDYVRKGKLAIDETLYDYVIEGHQAELYLLRETVLSLKG